MKQIFLTGLAAVLTAGPASAFYFPNWPGARLSVAPAIVTDYAPGDPPSVQPPTPPEPTTPTTPSPPGGVPEPGTLLLAGIGMAALLRRSVWRAARH